MRPWRAGPAGPTLKGEQHLYAQTILTLPETDRMPLNYSDMKGRHGAERAVEITVNLPDGRRTYSDTWVLVEGDTGLVHVLNREGTKHLASFPLVATSLIWDDMTELSR